MLITIRSLKERRFAACVRARKTEGGKGLVEERGEIGQ